MDIREASCPAVTDWGGKKGFLVLEIKGVGAAGIFPLEGGCWSDAIVITVSGNFPQIGKAEVWGREGGSTAHTGCGH